MNIVDKIDKYIAEAYSGNYPNKAKSPYVADKYSTPEEALKDGNEYIYMIKVITANSKQMSIGEWDGEITDEMGAVEFFRDKDEKLVYITPFMEGAKGVAYEMNDPDTGEEDDGGVVPFKLSGNPKKDMATYVGIAKKILKKYS